ncbi:hypothetical protein INR49_025656 [Caranx melampygus]|nr:hypothetical protein INR49_025656 [Caranx melampygus]
MGNKALTTWPTMSNELVNAEFQPDIYLRSYRGKNQPESSQVKGEASLHRGLPSSVGPPAHPEAVNLEETLRTNVKYGLNEALPSTLSSLSRDVTSSGCDPRKWGGTGGADSHPSQPVPWDMLWSTANLPAFIVQGLDPNLQPETPSGNLNGLLSWPVKTEWLERSSGGAEIPQAINQGQQSLTQTQV